MQKMAPANVAGVLDTADYLGVGASVSPGTDIGDFKVTWEKLADNTLKIEIHEADTIGDTALATLKTLSPDPTVKIVDGITWGS